MPLKVGQGYRWKIEAATDFEYGLIAPAFFRNIWIRKIETGSIEVKTAPLDELEFGLCRPETLVTADGRPVIA